VSTDQPAEPSNYERAKRTADPSIRASLALADAINQLREDVVAELVLLRKELHQYSNRRLHRG